MVADDVERLLVTREWAAQVWGVVINPDGSVEEAATATRREALREERRQAAAASGAGGGSGERVDWDPESEGVRLLEALFYDLRGAVPVYRCRCGAELGPAEAPYKEHAAQARFPVQRIGPEVNPNDVGGGRFELREFYCPGCFTLLEVEIARPADPLLDDARLTGLSV
jgi:N-methylhydantoinase B